MGSSDSCDGRQGATLGTAGGKLWRWAAAAAALHSLGILPLSHRCLADELDRILPAAAVPVPSWPLAVAAFGVGITDALGVC